MRTGSTTVFNPVDPESNDLYVLNMHHQKNERQKVSRHLLAAQNALISQGSFKENN
jgi:hypothetical protein